MGYENASFSVGARQMAAMVKNGRVVFNNIVQRSYVWERTRKSLFIHSLALGIPIPTTYAKKLDDGSGKKNSNVYDMLDGKQRLSTVSEFINDELKLSKLPPVTFFNNLTNETETEDISNRTFSELSEGLQEKIKDSRISIVYFENLTKEEERELFKRINNGKPLTVKSRVLASCRDIEGLVDIGEHSLFKEMLTEKALDNKNHISILMKVWCMLNQDISEISFEGRRFNPIIETAEINEAERLVLRQVFDRIRNIHAVLEEKSEKRVAKKLYTETHMVSLIPFIQKSIEDGLDEELMSDWLVEFYKPIDGNKSISEDYNNATGAGSAKNVNIQIRHNELEKSFTEFFKVDDMEDKNTVGKLKDIDSSQIQKQEEDQNVDNDNGTNSFVDGIIADTESSNNEKYE